MAKKKPVQDEAVQNETPVEEAAKPQIQTSDIEDYFTAYANGVSVAHTFYDFQMHFSEVKIFDPRNIVAERFATILMSPTHAKVFLLHMAQNLSLYEAKFGEIKIPENFQQLLNVDVDAEIAP